MYLRIAGNRIGDKRRLSDTGMNKADVAVVTMRMSKQSVGGQVPCSLSCQATPGVCGQHWASLIRRGSGK